MKSKVNFQLNSSDWMIWEKNCFSNFDFHYKCKARHSMVIYFYIIDLFIIPNNNAYVYIETVFIFKKN